MAICSLAYICRKVGRVLFPKTKPEDYYSALYHALLEANKFSKNKNKDKQFNTVSSYLSWLRNNQETQSLFTNSVAGQVCNNEEERQTELLEFYRLLLCAFVPLWLFCQIRNNPFKSNNFFHPLTFMKKFEIIPFLKNL